MLMLMQTPAPQAPLPPPDLGRVIIDTGPAGPPEWIAPVAVIFLFAILATFLLYPMARAWARRHEAGGMDQGLLDEVNHLRDRVSDLEGQVGRMQELEERVDFAERLLAQREETVRLPREGGA